MYRERKKLGVRVRESEREKKVSQWNNMAKNSTVQKGQRKNSVTINFNPVLSIHFFVLMIMSDSNGEEMKLSFLGITS